MQPFYWRKTVNIEICTSIFKLIYLRSIAKQVIPTYINHSRPVILDGIHLFFWTRFWEDREARPVLICWAPSKEASGTIFITSLVWRGRGSNPRPPAYSSEQCMHIIQISLSNRSLLRQWNKLKCPKQASKSLFVIFKNYLEMILKWNKQNTVRLPQKYQFLLIKHKTNC